MNEELKALFGDGINVNCEVIPIAHLIYEGKSKRFITWTILDETPILSADDEQLFGVCSVDIDVFSDGNYLDIIKEIKILMKNNEWVWTGDSPEMYETDTGLYHRTCTFEKERVL
jgi:hypothetical protein